MQKASDTSPSGLATRMQCVPRRKLHGRALVRCRLRVKQWLGGDPSAGSVQTDRSAQQVLQPPTRGANGDPPCVVALVGIAITGIKVCGNAVGRTRPFTSSWVRLRMLVTVVFSPESTSTCEDGSVGSTPVTFEIASLFSATFCSSTSAAGEGVRSSARARTARLCVGAPVRREMGADSVIILVPACMWRSDTPVVHGSL